MTTKLTKPVHRESATMIRDKSKRRALICSMLPGDVIELRPKGTRQRYTMSIESAYIYAGRLAGEARRRAKREAK